MRSSLNKADWHVAFAAQHINQYVLDHAFWPAGEAVCLCTNRGGAGALRWHLPHCPLLAQGWHAEVPSLPIPVCAL